MRALPGLGLIAAFLALTSASGPPTPAQARTLQSEEGFEITGEVDALYPGVETTLAARVTNPQSFEIRVTTVEVTVQDAGPECPGSLLEVGPPAAAVAVPAGGTGTVRLPVRLDREAPDGCQGVVWPLVFVATAVGPGEADDDADPPPSGSQDQPDRLDGPGALAFTGSNVLRLAGVAALLVVLGLGLRRLARWRSRTRAASP